MLEQHKDHIKQICDLLGEDFDDPACREVLDHLNSCPTCKVYYDTVKKTVFLCKENDCPEELPSDAEERLMRVLDLDEVYKKNRQK